MQQISQHTRLGPEERVRALMKFNNRLKNTPKAMEVLDNWQMILPNELIKVKARELPAEEILFGNGDRETSNNKAEWAIKGRTSMFRTVDCIRWAFLYPSKLERESRNFYEALKRAGEKMNYKISEPKYRAISDDRQEAYIADIESIASLKLNFILIALPRADRYSAIKRRCLVDLGIPCQVVVKNKTMCHKNLDSIASKIAIQINCKLGGIPWMVNIPVKGLMTVGFDVSRKNFKFNFFRISF